MGRYTPPRKRASAPNGTVTLAIPSRGQCASHFARTLTDMAIWDTTRGQHHLHDTHPVIWTVGAAQIVNARNTLVVQFLERDADWLLFLDDDQVYPQELLEHLMAAADPTERPIVGVPVWRFAGNGDTSITPKVTHNVLAMNEHGQFMEWPDPLPENALVQVHAIGTGCLLIHRSALERMRDWSRDNNGGERWCWFRHNVYPGDYAEGEDLFFCRLAAQVGLPVFALTFTTLGHIKPIILDASVPAGVLSI